MLNRRKKSDAEDKCGKFSKYRLGTIVERRDIPREIDDSICLCRVGYCPPSIIIAAHKTAELPRTEIMRRPTNVEEAANKGGRYV